MRPHKIRGLIRDPHGLTDYVSVIFMETIALFNFTTYFLYFSLKPNDATIHSNRLKTIQMNRHIIWFSWFFFLSFTPIDLQAKLHDIVSRVLLIRTHLTFISNNINYPFCVSVSGCISIAFGWTIRLWSGLFRLRITYNDNNIHEDETVTGFNFPL